MADGPILVAGRSGQVAQAICQRAARSGFDLVAVGRPELDLANPASIADLTERIPACAIVNAAAYTDVDAAEGDVERAFAVNREGAARLARVAVQRNIPYLYISTDCVFDGTKPSPYREDDIPHPISVYGESKLAGENAVREACPAAVVLRTSWVYSSCQGNFVTRLLPLAETKDVVQVVDDQRGGPTAAADLADAILDIVVRLMGGNGSYAGIYHIAGQGETSRHEFAQAIFAGWGRRGRRTPRLEPIASVTLADRARRPLNSRFDCSKLATTFGIRLPPWQISLDAVLDELADIGAREAER